ncbi:hypothetical protein FHP88_15765 [Sedimenticola selenatireducens]|uniref:Uncharacterized protein n=1 Tax=Sedimenticola selenatireducens TaxID=191960 RepID=A0A557S0E1_9GAMM|nr:hypothetical protein [Sedimenticola selenatireducens]TVO70910.1 hypothetical protein FHP88_15765 [Sedimenticola selenatireducens]
MTFERLAKPKDGFSFWVGRLLVDVNWARTWTWCDQSEDNKRRTTHLISLRVVQHIFDKKTRRALTIILGPLKLMLGLAA